MPENNQAWSLYSTLRSTCDVLSGLNYSAVQMLFKLHPQRDERVTFEKIVLLYHEDMKARAGKPAAFAATSMMRNKRHG
jgi:hypothetical protein